MNERPSVAVAHSEAAGPVSPGPAVRWPCRRIPQQAPAVLLRHPWVEQLGAVLEVARVVVKPLAAPDETVTFENIDDLLRDQRHLRPVGDAVGVPPPEPV